MLKDYAKVHSDSGAKPAALLQTLLMFRREEHGFMTVFAIYILLMMLAVGGMGVDLMRNEMERTKKQNTLDRAILAAADLDQTQDPKFVVNDYFAKSGFPEETVKVEVFPTLNSRTVVASLETSSKTTFMKGLGADSLPIFVGGTATEWVPKVELSLVLDVSGSMAREGRIEAMRPAAECFVRTLLTGDKKGCPGHTGSAEPEGEGGSEGEPESASGNGQDSALNNISVNLIPYSGQTNPGPFMFDRLGGVRPPITPLFSSWGGVDIEDTNHFNYSEPLADVSSSADSNGDGYYEDMGTVFPNRGSCLDMGPSDFNHSGLPKYPPYQQTPEFQNFSFESGAVWGWCPYDDNAIMYAQNDVEALATRIKNMKLTDGTGTQYAMKWALALLDPTTQDDFEAMEKVGLVPTEFKNRPAKWTDSDTAKYIVLMTDGRIRYQNRPTNSVDPYNLWNLLFHRSWSYKYTMRSESSAFSDFKALCDLAKHESRDVVIYTIAFAAPDSAANQMKECASSPSHFFKADTTDISEIFQAISRQVRQLRLVY